MTQFAVPFSPPAHEALTRRRLLRLGATAMVAGLVPRVALARTKHTTKLERTLDIYNTHTGEALKTIYWADGNYNVSALQEVNSLLRDHHSGDITTMDSGLLDLLHTMVQILDVRDRINVISGYRSKTTNERLRRNNRGIAKHSLHIEGKAIDIRVSGRELSQVRRVALALERGGVGYYPRSNFLHIDTGPVRTWS